MDGAFESAMLRTSLTVTATADNGFLGGALLGASAAAAQNPFSNTPPFKGAKDLVQQPKCASWLTSLAQTAAQNLKGSALTPDELQQYANEIKGIPSTLDSTPTAYQQIANPINSEGFTTNAEVNLKTSPPSMTLYKGFFGQTFLLSQSQIVLHEAVHLVTYFGDRELATAATGKVYANTTRDNSEASEDWHNQLKKNCH
jgi:hypothetical protein